MFNGDWDIPSQLIRAYPSLLSIISKVTIPIDPSKDKLLWVHIDDGDLQLMEAYVFINQQFHELNWAKAIWSPDIPPSKSLLVWRIMHEKVSTDENLMSRGCYIPSFHIFFDCSFAFKLWCWLACCFNQ
jgi:hypothetical protein